MVGDWAGQVRERRGSGVGVGVAGVRKRIVRALGLIVVNVFAMSYVVPSTVRNVILRACGIKVGSVKIFSRCIFRADGLVIGDGTVINHYCLFDRGPITIGKNVFISSHVTLAGGNHDIGESHHRAGRDFTAPIIIGDGCWIGANVVVLAGVTIAPGCLIGAGSVVTADTERDCLYAGAPARKVRALDPAL